MSKTKTIGNNFESYAKDYLLQQGLTIIANNFRCKIGEIDLIARDKEYLVFIECKMRSYKYFGGALASVNYQKQRKIQKTAQFFLLKYHEYNNLFLRFDVLARDNDEITWLKNAF